MSLIHRGAEVEKGALSGSGSSLFPPHTTPTQPSSFWTLPPPQTSSSFLGAAAAPMGGSYLPHHALGGVLGGAAAAAASDVSALGTNKNPVIMAFVSTSPHLTFFSANLHLPLIPLLLMTEPPPPQAEPSLSSQIWRTLRTLGTVFLVVTCLGTIIEDKGGAGGLAKGLMGGGSQDLKPQIGSNTKAREVGGLPVACHVTCPLSLITLP